MKELVFQQNGKALTSSRLIAEKFGKQHAHILRDIKNMDCPKEFSESNFGLAEYLDNQGKSRPEYAITKDGFTFLVMGFTGKQAAQFKVEYINEFNRMEDSLRNPIANLTRMDLAKMIIESEEEKKLLIMENAEMKPKALFADTVSTSNDCILLREFSKYLGNIGISLGQNKLFEWMRKKGYLIKMGSDYNTPTQNAMNMGLFQVKKTAINHSDGSVSISTTSKITGKGQIYFVNKIKAEYDYRRN